MFTSPHLYGIAYMRVGLAEALADSSVFRFLGEQSSQNWEIPYLGRRWTAEKNLMPLALSLVDESITVQIHKNTHKQTVTDISTPCLLAYVDNNQLISYANMVVSLQDCWFCRLTASVNETAIVPDEFDAVKVLPFVIYVWWLVVNNLLFYCFIQILLFYVVMSCVSVQNG